MRVFPSSFADHLSSGATTLCRCWKLVRRDGSALGFTDHDRDLQLSGLLFAALSGLEGAEVESKLGLAVGGTELAGVLTSNALTDAEIAGGVWDGATVETWLVNWAEPDTRILLDIGQIGEIRREDFGFTAEVRGLAQRFDEERGRIYQASCNADLGDARCGVDASAPAYRASGAVATTDGSLTLTATFSASFATGWFEGGSISFVTGGNAGALFEVRQHTLLGSGAKFVLWWPASALITAGDQFVVQAGCSKSLETCRTKFSNAVNFRGFPSIPTNDFVLNYARQGDASQDGGVLS